MWTLSEQQLISILNTHTPLEVLRDDYKSRLAHEADDGGFVPHSKVAKFLASQERKAMDKEYVHKKMMLLQANSDGDGSKDFKGRL